MESIYLYLLNRKPTSNEKIKYRSLSQLQLNKIIIRSSEYTKFLEMEKQRILSLIIDKLSISVDDISLGSRDIIFQKMLDMKRKTNYSNQKIIEMLDEIKKVLKQKLEFSLGNFAHKIFQYYRYLGAIQFTYLENDLVFNLKKLDNLDKCYQTLVLDDRFINFVENSIDKCL
tara:strand:+ start:168 stop:683 length:516 start_codon:yes stop_codon:yes gene_type:complete